MEAHSLFQTGQQSKFGVGGMHGAEAMAGWQGTRPAIKHKTHLLAHSRHLITVARRLLDSVCMQAPLSCMTCRA